MVTTGAEGMPGINGGLMKNTDVKTTTNTIAVDSVDASVEAVTKAGGKLVMPKTTIPTVGYFAYLTDTEGNLFGVMQTDKNAKCARLARCNGARACPGAHCVSNPCRMARIE